ncbi:MULTISPECIES: DNA polymerase III subunit chi [Ramlibacter]|jgi:DNA polymerase-3 subunit chi|uniref:DNA polymerase III subunit chi n=1 Tax=Ramlibacter pinisoli TaxID=2682844 RepID=A0A6N8IXN5_9BURK|nr:MULTISPECIES: DNA polymerase III subunit chi [Ramlibacter]MBA2960863.1 DNA polymerase III subunit chi [Ramlibacter sp. CGMCC 1.13660]MVQ30810.1 DNA polymerase III subunit chi [Ramlibacter pinisoli]
MTEVAFHFNAPDKVGYACRLLRKAWSTGARVVVTGASDLLKDLDVALWTFAPLEFVPHCLGATQGERVQARTPIVLSEAPRAAPHQQVLVNLGGAVPDGFERFERLIEVVTHDQQDRALARQRWKHYADRGYAIVRHDLAEAR